MKMNYDYVVLGGGCIGSAIAKELSSFGVGQFALVDHSYSKSATAHSAGMIRVFHENQQHVELALNNFKLLNDLNLHKPNGSLYFIDKNRLKGYDHIFKMMTEADYPFEVLSSTQGAKRFSQFNWKNRWAIYEPLATSIDPKKFCTNMKNQCERNKTIIHDRFEVKKISYFKQQYRLSSEENEIVTKNLILAGGARLMPRLKDIGLQFPLESKIIKTYTTKNLKSTFGLPNFFDRETLEFGKLGNESSILLSNKKIERLRRNEWDQFEENSSLDCYGPNRLGLLGEVSGYPGLILATGWGGTAFKFSLEIGKRTREIVENSLAARRT